MKNISENVILVPKNKRKEDLSVSEYHLPNGFGGIDFQPMDGNQGRYEIAVAKFKEWACQQKPIPFLP